MDERLKITEIFHSIQGESTLAGERFSFVRLTGCPLRCTYCDTTYSYTGGQWRTVHEIVTEVLTHQTRWVCITGGEPLVQKNCLALVNALRSHDLNISIETDGEEDVAPYAGLAKIILDIKTPGSGELAERAFANLDHLKATDEIKFVLTGRVDYEWAKTVVTTHRLDARFTVLFSPVFKTTQDGLELKSLADWIIADSLNVRLQTQLHKHIWGTDRRGV
ncbi:MAG TPA: radical SAM protein [Oligoflexia bacterium]|nr:radical SAM protein [Oligoflexia bacterium]